MPHDFEASDDTALMQLTAQGDEAAFEVLVERYQGLVVGTVSRMLGHAADAEDVAQMVFLRVWKNAVRYRPEAAFTTWLLTITKNLVFTEIRRRQRHPSVNPDPDLPAPDPADPTTLSAPDAIAAAELQNAIDAAIAALPEQQRLALVLRRYQELPYDEIATVLDTSESAVKSLLFRARAELKSRLAPWLDER